MNNSIYIYEAENQNDERLIGLIRIKKPGILTWFS